MLKGRMKGDAADAARAARLIVEVRTSIAALCDDDLLDPADIFPGDASAVAGAFASAAMRRRNLRV
ncbi:MAG: hypothetical protein V4537_01890 [Pseudomonadota bacterium]